MRSASNGQPSTAGAEVGFAGGECRHASQSQETQIASGFLEESALPSKAFGIPEGAFRMDRTQDSWPFDWSTVDIPGSPGLSRLFKGLEIDAAAHVPQLALGTLEPNEDCCLSPADIQEEFHERNDMVTQYWSCQMQWASMSPRKDTRTRNPQYPWRNIENVYVGYYTSPLREIYVFPRSSPSRHSPKCLGARTLSWPQLITQERDLETRLLKLGAHFSEDNSAILAVMETLADVLAEVGKYEKAERLQRRLVEIYRQRLGSKDIKVLNLSSELVQFLRLQGRVAEAGRLNDEIRSAVEELGQAGHNLALQVVMTAGTIAATHGQYKVFESLQREALQMALSYYGPRHRKTIQAISELGKSICVQKKREGEILIRTAVQLCVEEVHGGDLEGLVAMYNVCWGLGSIGALKEGYNLSTEALKRFGPQFEGNRPQILHFETLRAWLLLKRRKLAESESMFRSVLSRQVEAHLPGVSNVYSGLASVLCRMGQYEEATAWNEKSFHSKLTQFGALAACHALSDSYEEQGRLTEALEVYRQMIERVPELDGDSGETVAECEAEISRIEEKLQNGEDDSDLDVSTYYWLLDYFSSESSDEMMIDE